MTMTDMTLPPATDDAAGSGNLAAENLARLKALFPQIVRDGRIDVEVLRALVGEQVEDGEERYGLNWKGKAAARAHALTPSQGTLRPAKADSVDWDSTQNIMIEGDNLEVLKLLRRSYAGKVKLIYIDPPYNTGRDFVYPDNFRSPLAAYEALTGQKDRLGVINTSNRESAGRFHTDWLCMMYPRLMLAKELLTKDGVIVISSDDAELDNLRHILKDVFHENGFAVQVIWKKRSTPPNDQATKLIDIRIRTIIQKDLGPPAISWQTLKVADTLNRSFTQSLIQKLVRATGQEIAEIGDFRKIK
jgi:adenine-specific DNA-methyltransferase